jgi:hypothetical protein
MTSLPLELLDHEAIAAIFDAVATDVFHELFCNLDSYNELAELGASMTELYLLAALTRNLEHRLPAAVAFARDQAFSWDEIGQPLGITGSTAHRRYRPADPANTTERNVGAHPRPTPAP